MLSRIEPWKCSISNTFNDEATYIELTLQGWVVGTAEKILVPGNLVKLVNMVNLVNLVNTVLTRSTWSSWEMPPKHKLFNPNIVFYFFLRFL